MRYLGAVNDYRGFDSSEGWRHGVAHGADLLMQLSRHPSLARADLLQVLDAVAAKIAPDGEHSYVFGEPESVLASQMRALPLGLATLALLGACGSGGQAAPQPYKFIEGRLPVDVQPDGNSIIFEDSKGLVVIDTGRHPEHSDKILAYAKERGKPVTAIVNTHWHLDHSSGNARIRAVYPRARLYSSEAVVGALKGFLIRNAPKSREQLTDPATPEARKAAIRLYLAALDDPANLIPDMPVTGPTTIALGDRTLELRLAKHAATCVNGWMKDAAKFVATYPDRKDAEDSIAHYIDRIVRSPEKQAEFCGL